MRISDGLDQCSSAIQPGPSTPNQRASVTLMRPLSGLSTQSQSTADATMGTMLGRKNTVRKTGVAGVFWCSSSAMQMLNTRPSGTARRV